MLIKKIAPVIFIVIGFVFLTSLGVWQLQRLQWKEKLLLQIENNRYAPPITLPELEAQYNTGKNIEYKKIKLQGTFQHQHEQHYWATHQQQVGYFIYTPLQLFDGRILFINRGLVPVEKKLFATRKEPQTQVEVVGYVRIAPDDKPNIFTPDNDLIANIYYWRGLADMKKNTFGENAVEILPFFVETINNKDELPQGNATRFALPNSHLQYAITWFSLAFSLLVVGFLFLYYRKENK